MCGYRVDWRAVCKLSCQIVFFPVTREVGLVQIANSLTDIEPDSCWMTDNREVISSAVAD